MIDPAVGASAPAMRLKSVVLPAPFGPMRPAISPSLRSKETSATATAPPKAFLSARISSMSPSTQRTAAVIILPRPPPDRTLSMTASQDDCFELYDLKVEVVAPQG